MRILAEKLRRNPPKVAHQRTRIRKLFSLVLYPAEVDFLVAVWKAGNIRIADCPKVAVSLSRRGWLKRDGRTVRLSDETELLIVESGEQASSTSHAAVLP